MSPRIQHGTTGPTRSSWGLTRMVDGGTISPKAIAAVITAVITYIIGQEALDLPTWVEVLGQAVLVGTAAYAARPGAVVPDPKARARVKDRISDERGYGLVETAIALLIIVVAVVLLLRLL